MFDKLIDVLLQWVHLLRVRVTVHAYQSGVVLRWGRVHREVGPGVHWFWPFGVEEALVTHTNVDTFSVSAQSLTSKDNVEFIVSAVVTYKVADVNTFLIATGGIHSVIEECVPGAVARFAMTHTWAEIRGVIGGDEKAIEADNEIAKAVRRQAKKRGVLIENVQLRDLSKSRSIRHMAAVDGHILTGLKSG